MRVTVTDDNKAFKDIEWELLKLSKAKLILRIDPEAIYDNGTKVDLVGMWMEFGWDEFNVKYPARPFFRSAIDSNLSNIMKLYEKLLDSVVDGTMKTDQLLNKLGKYCVTKIKAQISNGSYVTLAESTMIAKGSSKPLIDTRMLYKSIQYVIEGI